MFSILDGREYFFQWDTDRKLIVHDSTIKEVHFCNRTDECSLVCEVYTESGVSLVNVPNILLQDNWKINVYAYDGQYTKHSKRFDVKSRSKPSDYVYTETEVKNYERLKTELNQYIDEVVKELEVTADLTGYATEEYVNKAIEGIEVPEVDLSNYYTKQQTNTAITNAQPDLTQYAKKSEVPSTSGLATENYVDNAVSNVKVDLTGYATENYVDMAIPTKLTELENDLYCPAEKTILALTKDDFTINEDFGCYCCIGAPKLDIPEDITKLSYRVEVQKGQMETILTDNEIPIEGFTEEGMAELSIDGLCAIANGFDIATEGPGNMYIVLIQEDITDLTEFNFNLYEKQEGKLIPSNCVDLSKQNETITELEKEIERHNNRIYSLETSNEISGLFYITNNQINITYHQINAAMSKGPRIKQAIEERIGTTTKILGDRFYSLQKRNYNQEEGTSTFVFVNTEYDKSTSKLIVREITISSDGTNTTNEYSLG